MPAITTFDLRPETLPASRWKALFKDRLRLALLAVIVFRTALLLGLGLRPFDDSFITFRYVLNLVHGQGFVFNPGEHVLGTTTPLWTLLLTLPGLAGLSIPGSALVISVLADALTALLLLDLLLRLKFSRAVAYGSSLLFLSLVDYANLARSGLETAFAVCLIFATLHALSYRRLALAGFLSGLTTLTRPEGIILLAVVGAYVLVTTESLQALPRRAALALLPYGATLAPWLIFATAYFGSPLPQSVLAKAKQSNADFNELSNRNIQQFFVQGQFGESLFSRTLLQANWALSGLAMVAIVSLVWQALRYRKEKFIPAVILVSFPVGFVGLLTLTHAFTWFPWYYGPIYPFLALLSLIGVARLLDFWPRLTLTGREWALGGLVALLIAGQFAALLVVKIPAAGRDYLVQGLEESVAGLPKDPAVKLASGEIGIIGYKLYPTYIDDLAGLTNPATALVNRLDYLKATRPEYLALRTDEGAFFLQDPLAQTWLSQNYEIVRTLPDPYSPRQFVVYHRRTA